MKLFILILSCISLFAGPPMKSSDPFVPDLGDFEINIAIEIEDEESISKKIPIIDINYAPIDNLQLTFETSYLDTPEENGFKSLELAMKWLFYNGDFFAVALYPKYKIEHINSTLNQEEIYELTIPMNFRISDSLDLIADITYVNPQEGQNYFEAGTYLKYSSSKHTYYAEASLEDLKEENQTFVLANLGYMYQFHENVAFMISVGKELSNVKSKVTVCYSGLQFIF